MRELLIVGVDPGTTVGYAALDIAGKVLRLRSSKQLELNSLLEELVKLGSILAIGTDKKNCPGLVEKTAAATGAKTITPKEDLAVSEKEELTRGIATSTEHEKDALAAALYAYREIEPLLQRIRKTLEAEGKQHIYREVTETVVTEGINIKEALRQVEQQMAEKMPASEEAITAQKDTNAKEARADKRLSILERENGILRGYVSKLLERIRKAEKERDRLAKDSRQGNKARLKENLDEKEKNHAELLIKLQKILNEREKQISRQNAEMQELESIAASGNSVVKKLNTLGFDELRQKNSFLKIGENDVVLVENPDSFSEKTLYYLREKGVTILARKRPSPAVARLLNDAELTTLPAEEIIISEAKNFAAADRKRLEEARKKRSSNVLGLIENYKEERKIELM